MYHTTLYNSNYCNNDIRIGNKKLTFIKENLTNPNSLFVSLYCNSNYKIKFGLFDNTINVTNTKFKWSFINNSILNLEHKLYLTIYKNKLIGSRYKSKSKWDIVNKFMKHRKTGLYIGCDFEYNIVLTLDKSKAIQFNIEHTTNYIHLIFFKSVIRLNFERNNLKYNVKIHKFMLNIYKQIELSKLSRKLYTICSLLSAGTSSRFQDTPIATNNITTQEHYKYQYKQIHLIENKPVILYSIENIIDNVDKLIIITNSECYDDIKTIITDKYSKIIVLKNDINCILESINTGLQYINKYYRQNKNLNNIDNIIIHDVARPYITQDYIQKLISSDNHTNTDTSTYLYSQYYLKLTNGLMNLDNNTIVDRNKYIELCTPLCINYKLFNFIFTNYIEKNKSITSEFIPILQLLNIKINLIEGHYKYLRKITTRDDI